MNGGAGRAVRLEPGRGGRGGLKVTFQAVRRTRFERFGEAQEYGGEFADFLRDGPGICR